MAAALAGAMWPTLRTLAYRPYETCPAAAYILFLLPCLLELRIRHTIFGPDICAGVARATIQARLIETRVQGRAASACIPSFANAQAAHARSVAAADNRRSLAWVKVSARTTNAGRPNPTSYRGWICAGVGRHFARGAAEPGRTNAGVSDACAVNAACARFAVSDAMNTGC